MNFIEERETTGETPKTPMPQRLRAFLDGIDHVLGDPKSSPAEIASAMDRFFKVTSALPNFVALAQGRVDALGFYAEKKDLAETYRITFGLPRPS